MSNEVRLFMTPPATPSGEHQCGVDVVVAKMHELLPKYGISVLTTSQAPTDVVAAHINAHNTTRPPDVLHCHGLYPTGDIDAPNWMWRVNQSIIDCALQVDFVTVPSPWVQQLFARDMGFLPEVVPHGLDLRRWPETSRALPNSAGRLKILWNKNRASSVCDVAPVNLLAEALPSDMRLVSTLGNSTNRTRILGTMTREKMRSVIYETDVYFASTRETFGIGTLEALAAGCPVLGWNWGHTPGLIEDRVDGYLVPPGDIDETVIGLRYIQENYERMSIAARAKAAQYPWKNPMLQYADIYRRVLALRESPARDHITIVVPCYNYASYVSQAIDSIKAQTYQNFDCIIVDDGSTDTSRDVIKEAIAQDDRFQLVEKPNSGVASARNLGAYRATGEYIAFLDADDILRPTCLHDLLPPLQQDRRLGLSYGGLGMIDPEGRRTRDAGGLARTPIQ